MFNIENLTPKMKQYKELKKGIPEDTLLLFKMGDFYEMFFEDAVRGSKLMDITLTKRAGIAMCGIPVHALDKYLYKITEQSVKVAIAEPVEDDIKHEITKMIIQ